MRDKKRLLPLSAATFILIEVIAVIVLIRFSGFWGPLIFEDPFDIKLGDRIVNDILRGKLLCDDRGVVRLPLDERYSKVRDRVFVTEFDHRVSVVFFPTYTAGSLGGYAYFVPIPNSDKHTDTVTRNDVINTYGAYEYQYHLLPPVKSLALRQLGWKQIRGE